ncbi:hypothetical protein HAX54_003103 [Datura stramonium]|uniref:Uncharacterized protein n=1 Tax=Datura stramonium TaxID=4076 RepID=A0ABS8RTJ7_DATST|nr:hypothetical protein [Datura stramonium]
MIVKNSEVGAGRAHRASNLGFWQGSAPRSPRVSRPYIDDVIGGRKRPRVLRKAKENLLRNWKRTSRHEVHQKQRARYGICVTKLTSGINKTAKSRRTPRPRVAKPIARSIFAWSSRNELADRLGKLF